MTAPEPGTPEYQWWAKGTLDEAEARDEDLTPELRQARDLLVDLGRARPDLAVHDLLGRVTVIYCSGKLLRDRLRIAWRIVR